MARTPQTSRIPRRIVPAAPVCPLSPGQVAREFQGLLDAGWRLRPTGSARSRPRSLLRRGYTPRYKVELFDSVFYLTNVRQNPDIRFFVAYVLPDRSQPRARDLHPRIFYKDISLVWRSASHWVRSAEENWIGKGDVVEVVEGGEVRVESAEETTDLPLEIQDALEELMLRVKRPRRDDTALGLCLRGGSRDRIEPYADFTTPRRRAAANPANRVNGGRKVARFARPGDPTSLRFVAGFEPDFRDGVLESSQSRSRMYGGSLRRFRILSRNQLAQYLFFAGPRHVWIIPPQATTTELSSFGVRTVDVRVDEDLCLPGFEYHFLDTAEDPPVWVSQIPKGYAGAVSEVDDSRCDASPWLDRMPVVQEFRRRVLGQRQSSR